MRLCRTIALALSSGLLSMSLAGCGERLKSQSLTPNLPPQVVTLRERPSTDLLVCSERPEGFSADAWGIIPPEVRGKLIEVFTAMRKNADQLDRLINWHAPGSCL